MLFKKNPVLLSQQAVYSTPLESAVLSVASQTHGAKCRAPSGGQVMKRHYNMIEGCFSCLFFTFLKFSFIGH